MTSQQLQVDTISNNLANVNTTSYKKESVTFKSLLYTQMQGANIPNQQPVPMQVGHGVRVGGMLRNYSNGILQETGNATDLAIEGNGFFTVLRGEQVTYTRDGNFRYALTEDGMRALVTSDGFPVLSVDEEPILIDEAINIQDVVIGREGNVFYIERETNLQMDIAQIMLVQFPNKEGLEALGSNLYAQTAASGEPIIEAEADDLIIPSSLRSGFLEGSNVSVAEEMVNLIVAQRAYELNSTSIKAADTMLQQANQLKS
jgi:flagellar basal-body rod protein FlgG